MTHWCEASVVVVHDQVLDGHEDSIMVKHNVPDNVPHEPHAAQRTKDEWSPPLCQRLRAAACSLAIDFEEKTRKEDKICPKREVMRRFALTIRSHGAASTEGSHHD